MYANVGILAADPCSQGRGRRCPPTHACLPGRAVIYGATPFDRAVNSRTRDGMFRRSRLIDKHRPGTPGRGRAMLRGRASALGVNCRCGERTASRRGVGSVAGGVFRCRGLTSLFSQIWKYGLRWARTDPCSSAAGGPLPLAAAVLPTPCLFSSPCRPSETGDIRLLHSSRDLFFYSFLSRLHSFATNSPLASFLFRSSLFSLFPFTKAVIIQLSLSSGVQIPQACRLCLKKSLELSD